MRPNQHLLPLSLIMLAACAGQDQISGTDASKSASGVLAAKEVAPANNSAERQYRVTIENMTTGQVFSPGVIATHTASSSVWRSAHHDLDTGLPVEQNEDVEVSIHASARRMRCPLSNYSCLLPVARKSVT